MGVSWTEEQQKVIDTRNCNILVSAAAGSGKTAVLVERIIQRITDKNNPVDIDELLIVTFTRAAAGEMKERISQAIEKKLEENPEDEHLQRQSTLVHHALITTIDSFCSYIVKNYFHLIDLDPSFRMGDEGEMRLLQADVADAVLEEAYAEENPSFLAFADGFAGGKTDKKIPEMIIKLYSFSMSYPYPEEWLLNCRKAYEITSIEELENADWMKLIKSEVKQEIKEASMLLKQSLEVSKEPDGPVFYIGLLEDEVSALEKSEQTESFFEWKEMLDKLEFKRLPAGKKVEKELVSESRQELAKNLRSEAKDQIKALKERYFQETAEEMLENLQRAGEPVGVLVDLTLAFMKLYKEKKKEKNILDFGDLEHYALEILTYHTKEKDERTDAAKELSKKFVEIMIDEYQDSNLVQEKLLTSVSRIEEGIYNIFMVGDVKQSIYRFRLARPDLFMEKFKTYPQEAGKDCLRIDLHKNFRSRAEVLEGVNYLFYQIMGEDLGGVEYDRTAALYPGKIFLPKPEEEKEPATEVLLLEDNEEENSRESEARAVALRIGELVGNYLVLDKETEEYRSAKYSDFTILLRTMSGWAETFKKILNSCGIPASVTTKTGYFSAQEVMTVLDYLKILDNPMQDIPLAAALHGLPDGFTFQELAEIKVLGMENEKSSFYEALLLGKTLSSPLGEKIRRFFAVYRELRRKVPYTPMHELIWDFYDATDFLVYQQAFVSGEQRKANLLMLAEKARDYESTSYRGLFNFIRYIENLKKYQVDFGEANILSENQDTVRIMSIHGSKGLEFPIVFVCGMGKQINMQDARESIVLHPDLGIGAPYVDTQLRIRTRTILQKAVQREILLESLGEELRILYVALTRAKEKLILTGVLSKLEDTLKGFEMLQKQKEERLPYGLRVKGKSYLDWVLKALARHRAMKPLYETYHLSAYPFNAMYDREPDFTVRQVQPLELVLDEAQLRTEEMLKKGELLLWDSKEVYDEKWRELFQDSFSYEYPYQAEGTIPVKLTVSEVKRMQNADIEESEMLLEEETEEIVPLFMKETKEELKGAAKGTLYHRVWENLDYEKIDTKEQIEEQLKNILTTEEKKSIWTPDFLCFAKSSLAGRMKAAYQTGKLYREQPFVIAMPANQIREEYKTEEEILVQGILDAYFEEKDGLVLVDYKTDKVQQGQEKELVEKYIVQMQYYKKALEMITDKEVKEIYIYSTGLGKAVLVYSPKCKPLSSENMCPLEK